MLPVCLVLIYTSCWVRVHCVQPRVIHVCPFISALSVLELSFVKSLSITCSICCFIPGNSLFYISCCSVQTAQGSMIHFAWLAHWFLTVSLPAFARVSKVCCLFLTPEPLTPISLISTLVFIEFCCGFMLLLCFFYLFSFISVFIICLWGAPHTIKGINWRNPASSCLWCTDCIVRRISKASKWRSKVTPGNFLLLGELKVTATVEQLLYEASNSLYVTRVVFFRACLLMQLQMYI